MVKLFVLITIFYAMLSVHTSKAQDWAQTKRFETANKELMTSSNTEERIVFMGNSITEGWLHEDLSLFKNPNYINRGIGGQTTAQMIIRFPDDVIALKPSAVVILAGINDIAQNTGYIAVPDIAANIAEMASLASRNNVQVFICSVLPANTLSWRPQINPSDQVIQLNELLHDLSKSKGYVYIDFYTAMVNESKGLKDEYTYDGVHCTLTGYRKMEKIIEGYLLESLKNNKK